MQGKYKHKLTGEIYEVIVRKKDLFMRCIFSHTNKSDDYYPINDSWNKFENFVKLDNEFNSALETLFNSKENNNPTIKRFENG